MRYIICLLLLRILAGRLAAGDGVDGPNRYEADFSREHTRYTMTKADERWTASLLRNLKESGKVTYFTRTDLPIMKDGRAVRGLIYQRIDKPQYCYISDGDVMLDLDSGLIYSPGVGGFSMHSPKSRDFIVCLLFQRGGVPIMRHSEIARRQVWWFSTEKYNRLEHWQ